MEIQKLRSWIRNFQKLASLLQKQSALTGVAAKSCDLRMYVVQLTDFGDVSLLCFYLQFLLPPDCVYQYPALHELNPIQLEVTFLSMNFIKGKRNLEFLNLCMGILDNTRALAIYLKNTLLSIGNDIKKDFDEGVDYSASCHRQEKDE